MPEQALYLKWRPLSFDDVVGQEHITRTLRNSLKTGRIRHAYLFSGPRGTGKTTTARLLAKAVNCTHQDSDRRPCNECSACLAVNEGRFLDLIEIDAASHTGVDDVRELRDRIAFAPNEGRYKVYIIDEVHRFSGNAFDALLKTLEEPPDHALFVLATTEIDKVPATIKSRCLPFEFRRLSLQEVSSRLRYIVDSEGLQIDDASLELIAREGTGSVRDSISLLDQIVADPDEAITLDLTQRILGTASLRAVRELVESLIAREVSRSLHVINSAIDAGSDPRQFGQQVVEHLRAVLLAQTASADLLQASQDDQQMYDQQARAIDRSRLLKAIRSFNDAVNAYSGGWQPQLALELAVIETMEEPEVQVVTMTATAQPAISPAVMSSPAAAMTAHEAMPLTSNTPKSSAPPIVSPDTAQQQWLEAQRLIHSHRSDSLPALMQHARVKYIDGNTFVMGVDSELHLQKLRDPERVRWIERALVVVYDEKYELHVRFELGNSSSPNTGQSRETSAGENDHLVQFAENEFGGELKSSYDNPADDE